MQHIPSNYTPKPVFNGETTADINKQELLRALAAAVSRAQQVPAKLAGIG